MGGDELVALVRQRLGAAPMRNFLAGLREEAVIKPNHAMAKSASRMRQPDFVGSLGRHAVDARELGDARNIAFLALLPWRRFGASKGRNVEGAHHGIG
ncbi:hypothetical protein [Polyangium aurulentum]|uniref:hypothetical protein n=1 Tax=Polyangium aurulentum TaxID=2567896 RepID=UPI00146D4705|nr:hypothetical protein [Polyangium aurulentum]UQA56329.1 hypothetical protein E8A73_034185 [Polyangium aurulentum]